MNVASPSYVIKVIPPGGWGPGTYRLIDTEEEGDADTENFSLMSAPKGYHLAVIGGDLVLTVDPNYWKGAGSSNWNSTGNWKLETVPAGAGAIALFSGAGDAGGSPVNVDGATTIGTIQYDGSAASYTISGSTLTFDNGGSNAAINQDSGAAAQIISAPISLNSNLVITGNSNGVTLSGGISAPARP